MLSGFLILNSVRHAVTAIYMPMAPSPLEPWILFLIYPIQFRPCGLADTLISKLDILLVWCSCGTSLMLCSDHSAPVPISLVSSWPCVTNNMLLLVVHDTSLLRHTCTCWSTFIATYSLISVPHTIIFSAPGSGFSTYYLGAHSSAIFLLKLSVSCTCACSDSVNMGYTPL